MKIFITCKLKGCNPGFSLSLSNNICCPTKTNVKSYTSTCEPETCNPGYIFNNNKICCINIPGATSYDANCKATSCNNINFYYNGNGGCTYCSTLVNNNNNGCCAVQPGVFEYNKSYCSIKSCKINEGYALQNGSCYKCPTEAVQWDNKTCCSPVVGIDPLSNSYRYGSCEFDSCDMNKYYVKEGNTCKKCDYGIDSQGYCCPKNEEYDKSTSSNKYIDRNCSLIICGTKDNPGTYYHKAAGACCINDVTNAQYVYKNNYDYCEAQQCIPGKTLVDKNYTIYDSMGRSKTITIKACQ